MRDLIDRKAAIDAILKQTVCSTKRELVEICDANISDENGWLGGICIALDTIDDLPSAQPEIIRCKSCKYYNDHTEECDNDNGLRFLDYSNLDLMYCAWAERRTDEQV